LYNWNTARNACTKGWHLPSDAEWTALNNFVGSSAGKKLKATSGWNSNGNGTDEFGFSALPGGNGGPGGNFLNVGDDGRWWSATKYNANYAYDRDMFYLNGNIGRNGYGKDYLFSVRCLQD
jgi:uncharacterized protein (TIGR02145 family)